MKPALKTISRITFGIVVALALLGFCFLGVQYYRWREGLLPDIIHITKTCLSESSAWEEAHFGACLTDAQEEAMRVIVTD
jgi:hypothetical protein